MTIPVKERDSVQAFRSLEQRISASLRCAVKVGLVHALDERDDKLVDRTIHA